jgi:hypothetical protein
MDVIREDRVFDTDPILTEVEITLMEKLGISPEEIVNFMNDKAEDEEYVEGIKEARKRVDNTLRLLKAGEPIEQGHLVKLNKLLGEDEVLNNSYREQYIKAILEGYAGKE